MRARKTVWVKTVVFIMVFLALPSLALAGGELLGTWENTDEEYSPAEQTTITFRACGKALIENRLGSTFKSETVDWEADGNILRIFGVNVIGRTDLSFAYKAEGNRLILQLPGGEHEAGKKIIFMRVKGGE